MATLLRPPRREPKATGVGRRRLGGPPAAAGSQPFAALPVLAASEITHLCVFPEELCLTRNLWKACNVRTVMLQFCGKHVTYELFTLVWTANSPSGAVRAALESSFGDTRLSELRFNGGK